MAIVTSTIKCDLARNLVNPIVRFNQYDSGTRAIDVILTENDRPYSVEPGTNVSFAYQKGDGTSGWYDKLPDGSAACVVGGSDLNVVTVNLADQVLTYPGHVRSAVVLRDADLKQIATFPIDIFVERSVTDNNELSNNYYAVTNLDQINKEFKRVWDSIGSGGGGGTGGGGADVAVIERYIADHNVSSMAHSDIRNLITQLTRKLNAFLDSDDQTLDQLSELIAAIKKDAGSIQQLTSGKINKTDIVNDLITNVADKPLSAAQGVALKRLIDAIKVPTKLSDLGSDSQHQTVTQAEKDKWNQGGGSSGGGGLTPEQVQKLNEIDGKVSKTGHAANKYLGTDKAGNVIDVDAPDAGDAQFIPSPSDDPVQNSRALQSLIDKVSAAGGGAIHIPAGRYRFGSSETIHFPSGRISDCCVRMKSNVTVYGDGTSTVLLPVGVTEGGLDMFYFNDYREKGQANYLENCQFYDFVVDSAGSSCRNYTTAGKAFMFDLIRNCHWRNIVVLNTDGTGLGVDCPILCSIDHCYADGCGKGASATGEVHGGSGIGIGYGYSNQESMEITNCRADNNRNYGIFYEHQGRFKPELYGAQTNLGLKITNCSCQGNGLNYGAERATSVQIANCYSSTAKTHGYCAINAAVCTISDCVSNNDADGSYVVKTVPNGPNEQTSSCKDIVIAGCVSKYSGTGVKLYQDSKGTVTMERIVVSGNSVLAPKTAVISASGVIKDLFITGNNSESKTLTLGATGSGHIIRGNSWQSENAPAGNMEALTFTGAVNDSYNGSTPKTVRIPTVQDVLDALPKWKGGSF